MSTSNPHDAAHQANPEQAAQPRRQPMVAQPEYAQPRYAPPQPQYQAQAQAQPPQAYRQTQPWQPAVPAARSDVNTLGLIAFLIVLAVVVIWGFSSPFVVRRLSMMSAATFDHSLQTLLQWINVIVVTPLYLLALLLGLLGAKAQHRPRGRVLAYLAIGAAGAGILATIVNVVATRAAYGLLFF